MEYKADRNLSINKILHTQNGGRSFKNKLFQYFKFLKYKVKPWIKKTLKNRCAKKKKERKES